MNLPFSIYQVDDTEVISFLLSTEIIPLCLRTMEMGSELSKTVSVSFFHFSVFTELLVSISSSIIRHTYFWRTD